MVSIINNNNEAVQALHDESYEITGECSLLEEVSKLLTILSMLYIFPHGRGSLYKSIHVRNVLRADIVC
jgi:hypothetical protein